MGVWQNIKRSAGYHANKHIVKPYKDASYANSQYKIYRDTDADLAKEWKKERRKQIMKLTKTTAIAGGVAGGAAYVGKKIVAAPTAAAGKISNSIQNQYQASKNGYDFMILWTLIMYFFLSRFYRANLALTIAVHAIVILIVVVGVLPRSEKNKETYIVMAMIIAIEVVLPYFIYQLPFLMSNKFIVNYLINPQVTMLWFYFAVMRSSRQSFISKTAYFLVWAIWLGILLSVLATSLSVEDVKTALTPEQLAAGQSIYTKAYDFWKDAITHVGDIMEQGRRYWTNQLRYATGDYYTGAVDENQQETLGVFLEDLKPSDNEFYTTDTISVFGTLKAKTLEDGLRITVACYHGRKNKDGNFDDNNKGEVYPNPEDTMFIYDEETQDIDCRFPSGGGMEEGSNRVTLQADFNFETMAYLKTYFMDKDRIRSMQNQGIDPLGYYGIEDKDPKSRYTNGPVQIGMGITEDMPIGIRDRYSVSPRLGITLMSNEGWEGKIKQLDELMIMVPDSMSLNLQWCPEFEDVKPEEYETDCVENYKRYRSTQLIQCARDAGVDTQEGIDADGNIIGDNAEKVEECMKGFCKQEIENYRAYKLKIDKSNKILYSNIGFDAEERDHKTFSCRINLDEPSNILGDAPVAIHYFRAKARYTYEIEDYVNVDIKESTASPLIYNIQKPPSTEDAKEIISFIYNEYDRKEPHHLKRWCEATGLLGDVADCTCLLASIMATESRGDVRVKDGDSGKSKFLMQIQESTAKGIWDKFQLDACDLHDIDCNIMAAAYYLKSIEDSGKTDKQIENYAAAYNCGPKALYTTKDCEGMLNWQCPPNKNDNTAQCIINKEMTTRDIYVPKVMKYYETCKNLNLQTKYTLLPATEDVEGKGTITLSFDEEDRMVVPITGTPYILLFEAEQDTIKDTEGVEKTEYSDFRVTVYYKKTGNDKLKLTRIIDLDTEGGISYDDNFPVIRFERTGMEVKYSYLKKSASKEITLVKEDTIQKAGKDIEKHTNIFNSWIEAYYNDGEINLYDLVPNKFCTVPWGNYNSRLNGLCEEEDLFMFKLVNINTIEKDRSLVETVIGSEKKDTATVQLQFDPNEEHDCCSDCNTCKDFGEGLIPCSTCKNCVPKIVQDSVLCESGTLDTSSTTRQDTSSTADTNCCTTCSCFTSEQCSACGGCEWVNYGCIVRSNN